MPTADGAAVATTSYFVNDLVASQEVPGVQKAVWSLDPLQRFSTQETFASVNGAWVGSATHDPTVAAAAIAALRALGHREALPAIRALHDAPDPEVRRQVRSVLRA